MIIERRQNRSATQPPSRLGSKATLTGTLRFETAIEISGAFRGTIISPGTLHVLEGAEIEGEINVGTVVVHGTVRGTIKAEHAITVSRTGRLYANLYTASLRIADGVIFEGACEMIDVAYDGDIFSNSGEQLRSSIEHG